MSSKFIILVGGVYSAIGKGIAAASIAFLLQKRGSKVQLIKGDPYLNINAGTMNPRQHGEVFLCEDGSETDLDLGSYERLAGIEMSHRNIFTSGQIYQELLTDVVIGKKYLGETIQVVPHVTDKVKQRWIDLGQDCDIVIAEIGGTVGDMESEAFYDAARQMKQELGDDVLIILVAPIIWNNTVKEHKTKPLQNSVKTLQSKGLQPDMLLCRTESVVPDQILDKISRMTNVHRNSVFVAPNVKSIYEVPIEFWKSHIDDLIADKFHLRRVGCRIHKYKELVEAYTNGHDFPVINIGIVGKYENCDEAYHSLKEALTHAAVANNVRLDIRWINAEDLESSKRVGKQMDNLNGVIVPGGFDIRGVEGKIRAIEQCRTKGLPFLGICLGLQCSVIEFCRNVLGIEEATSEEFNREAKHKVIHYIPGQESILKKSGTMRLGAYECSLVEGSLVHGLYGKKKISERHRHRYEVNEEYVEQMRVKGYKVSGYHNHEGGSLVEMMELDQHPFFVATQSHAEYKSRLTEPAPLFNGLIAAAVEHHEGSDTKKGD